MACISPVQLSFLRLQIHNWGQSFDNQSPNLEYIAPSTVYTVVAGERTYLDLNSIPQLTPRQIRVLSSSAASPESSQIDSNLDEVKPCFGGCIHYCQARCAFYPRSTAEKYRPVACQPLANTEALHLHRELWLA